MRLASLWWPVTELSLSVLGFSCLLRFPQNFFKVKLRAPACSM